MSAFGDKVKQLEISVSSEHVRLVAPPQEKWAHDEWRCKVTFQGRSYTSDFNTGIGHRVLTNGWKKDADGLLRQFHGDRCTSAGIRYDQALEHGALAPVSPNAADVLSCLFLDADGSEDTFEDWADNLGENRDSRKALETYLACQRTRSALVQLFGQKLFDELMPLAREH